MEQSAAELHKHVPPDWYHRSIRNNLGQRFWHNQRFQHVKGLIEQNPEAHIVDIGCADGVFTKVIRDASHARSITGVDVLPSSIRWASEHWSDIPEMRFAVADAHDLPFDDASVDVVTCLEMLEHVFDPVRVLQEIQRILKPGGYAVLLVPADTPLFLFIWSIWQRFKGRIWHETHIQSFRGGKLGRMAAEQGYEITAENTCILGMLYSVKIRKPVGSFPDGGGVKFKINQQEFVPELAAF